LDADHPSTGVLLPRRYTIQELAAAEQVDRAYVGRVLNLTLLAPDIVEAIVDGRKPEDTTVTGLAGTLPAAWEGQRRL
jgi:hypothetical protein